MNCACPNIQLISHPLCLCETASYDVASTIQQFGHYPSVPAFKPQPCSRATRIAATVYRRKSKLKAKCESRPSRLSYKSVDPGAFNMGDIGSTCTALPRCAGESRHPGSFRFQFQFHIRCCRYPNHIQNNPSRTHAACARLLARSRC